VRLTDLSIKALPVPPKGQVTYIDDTLSGFGVRVSQGGVKAFVVVFGRSRRRVTLGRYPAIGLSDAKKAAKVLLAEKTLGKKHVSAMAFEAALKLFLTTRFPEPYPKPRTKAETTRLLSKHFLPALRHELLEDILGSDISRVLERLSNRPSEARHALVAVRQFFTWAVRRGYLGRNPIEHLRPSGQALPRDRVLTPDELKCILSTAGAQDSAFHRIVQLLLLTGQRRNEIASLRESWIDFDARTITLPPHITKNRRTHTFPFGAMAGALLKTAISDMRKRNRNAIQAERSELLFAARRRNLPFSGWSFAKPRFDRECRLPHWTLHDLRRTCATNLAALGVPVHVTEKLLNHVSGTTGGIVSVYQRHAYLDEMRAAILAWEARLVALTAPSHHISQTIEPPQDANREGATLH